LRGVNLRAFWNEQGLIDPKIVENSYIRAFVRVYGGEATRANIIKEINTVFRG